MKKVEAILGAAMTGKIGDRKIFVLPADDIARVRTAERVRKSNLNILEKMQIISTWSWS
jgi:nitrogen regulatory protein PII